MQKALFQMFDKSSVRSYGFLQNYKDLMDVDRKQRNKTDIRLRIKQKKLEFRLKQIQMCMCIFHNFEKQANSQ